VGVRLGIDHGSSKTSRSQEESGSNAHNDGGPNGEERSNEHESLLSSVGEVVVSGAHVVEVSSHVHSDESTIKVRAGGVELHAVRGISLNSILVVVVLLLQVSKGETVGLSEHAHPLSEALRLEERSVLGNPVIACGHRGVEVGNLHHVASVSLIGSFTSISCGVGVASGPLEVDVVSRSSSEVGRSKVVLSGGVSFHDVSSLSSNVKVEDSLKRGDSRGSGSDVEDKRSVLEGSSELGSVDGERDVESILSNVWVILERRVVGIGSPVNESSVGSIGVGSSISSGNVVSHSEDTVAVVRINARLVRACGQGPVVVGVESISGVSEVVVS